jgi:ABC-type glycerol-3-phosphate transport system substrate-binding protein
MMKKILALALAVTMLFAFAACGGSGDSGSSDSDSSASGDEDVSIVGEWKLVGAEAGGQTVDESQLGGLDYAWTFEEGDKASITIMGQSTDATYTFENNTVTFAEPASGYVLKLDGNQLVYEDEASATTLFFEK